MTTIKKILSKAKNPRRLIEHILIKFFNRKIAGFDNLIPFFAVKKGLEIGGPSRIFTKNGYMPLYPLVDTVDGVNFSTTTVWENTISEGLTYDFGNPKFGRQYIQDGTDLSVIESASFDFLLSSHSLEHIANPLKALTEWLRILRKGGLLVIVLPDNRYTFDCRRPITNFDHLLTDFNINTTETDLTHIEEILALHEISYDDGVADKDSFRKRSLNNFENRCLHHHVFDLNLMKQIFDYFDLEVMMEDVSPPFNLIMVGRKK